MSHSESDPTETAFSTKKEKLRWGKSQKCKGFFWRGACGLARTGGGAWSALRAKMGSSGFVKSHQESIFSEIVAREGGFFFGRAKRRPDVFRGEMGNWVRREPRFFVTAASGGFLVK